MKISIRFVILLITALSLCLTISCTKEEEPPTPDPTTGEASDTSAVIKVVTQTDLGITAAQDRVLHFTAFEAMVRGTFVEIATQVQQHGHCWTSNPEQLPTIADPHTQLGSTELVGSFDSQLYDLVPATIYYVRSYAIVLKNGKQEVAYHPETIAFTTCPNCFNDGICTTDETGTSTCKCPPGFSGERCEIKETFQQTYGGSGYDAGEAVRQTTDGGYIVAGYTQSYGSGGSDFWLLKTDALGKELWTQTYGGSAGDIAYDVQQTTDGGYILVGITWNLGNGMGDAWLLKTDRDGNELWAKTYGGTAEDRPYSLQQTNDGGFVLAGYTQSSGEGLSDFWLLKTDADGNELWSRTYGGAAEDRAFEVQQTVDGGFAIVGYTQSFGAGAEDVWLVKTDVQGNQQWTETFGNELINKAFSLQITSDNGLIIVGETQQGESEQFATWLIKTNAQGHQQWASTYDNNSVGRSVQQTQSDNGFIVVGSTQGFGSGEQDVYLLKTDWQGNELWSKTFGGSAYDVGAQVQETTDRGFVLTGYTESFGNGGQDVWLIKTDADGEP